MREYRYTTPHGIEVTRTVSQVVHRRGLAHLARELDRHRGIYLSSGYEYPGRYSRWDIGSACPPLEIVSYDRRVEFRPLNERGRKILEMFHPVLAGHAHWEEFGFESGILAGRLKPMPALFPEEERSRQPSVFSILRALIEEFREEKDSHLGLVGAFGYDLLFQFEPIVKRLPRHGHKDLHLFLCDDIFFADRKKEQIDHYQYDFEREGVSTRGLARDAEEIAPPPQRAPGPIVSDHTPEEYMAGVEKVRQGMARGDYYEVVLRQTFRAPYSGKASELFERVQDANPSPYEFFLQFGDEQLIGASPEMFVRVEESRVETCPIAGTAQRTGDPLRDAENVAELIGSLKEESELTMCTDVDRNDKSRVCKPGTVKVIERRLIEKYAGVFHTVDHVEGILRDDLDSLDAFLSHMWAVTLIGAPKKAAAQAIEALEKDARGWYGGAVGMISAQRRHQHRHPHSHHLSARRSGFVSRGRDAAVRFRAGHGRARDASQGDRLFPHPGRARSGPAAGRGEARARPAKAPGSCWWITTIASSRRIANYARQTGAEVVTYRAGFSPDLIAQLAPTLILISPGPGRPADFGVPDLVKTAVRLGLPVFGVCLGLQGIVEAFGGDLDVLDYPVHGKRSMVRHRGVGVFEGLPEEFQVGRYHSLYARRSTLPACLEVTAETTDGGIIMGVRHRELPIEAVQFHPESILTLTPGANYGLQLIENAVRLGKTAGMGER